MNSASGTLLMIFIILIFGLTCYGVMLQSSDEYKEVEHSGFVTDKWIENSMFLFFSNTDYILEINNEYIKEVTHFEYRNIEIGDIYYYTEWEYVDNE